jgi:uncharacterized surface protein with fasciclin (FAS1) repeats
MLVLAIAAVAALVAVGCGDDSDDGASAPASTEAAPAAPATSQQDIVQLASGNEDLSTLTTAVTAADLGPTLKGEGPYTVFAPTNAAFEALPAGALDELLEPANKKQLGGVLTYHVVPGQLKAADLSDGQKLETVNGETLTVRVSGEEVTVGGAKVVQPDVQASNGVVHVIDEVLQPAA